MLRAYDLHHISLLPLSDSASSSVSYEVYDKLDKYLKKEELGFKYISSNKIYNILSRYRSNLHYYLQEPSVLQLISEKLQVGSLIRGHIDYEVDHCVLHISIFTNLGRELFFKESLRLDTKEIDKITNTYINWIKLFNTKIGYDGIIKGVLGKEVTFEMRSPNLRPGEKFSLYRVIQKKKHPVLNIIVDYEKELIAKGQVLNQSGNAAIGKIEVYYGKGIQPEIGDHVLKEEVKALGDGEQDPLNKTKKANKSFGKLGIVHAGITLSSLSVSSSNNGSSKYNGFNFGLNAFGQLWLTRQYFVESEFLTSFGSQKKVTSVDETTSVSSNMLMLKVGGGYKYLLLGYFRGPQVEARAGYIRSRYSVDSNSNLGFGENTLSGLYLGVGGSVPIKSDLGLSATFDFVPFTNFDGAGYPSLRSASMSHLKVYLQYIISYEVKTFAGLDLISHLAKFKGDNLTQLSYNQTNFTFGFLFDF